MNQPTDSFKIFAAWLAALFLTAFGAQLWIAWLYGSPLPIWDQWYEADSLFRPWVNGQLALKDLFASDSNHRIPLTYLLDLGLISLNGRWDPMLQMTVNAAIHAAFACGLAYCLWHFGGRKNGWLVCLLLSPFFALPYGGENVIWGINSLWYLVNIFALATVVGVGFGKLWSWQWWAGCAAGIFSLLTMASGFLAPVAAGGLIIFRAIKNRRMEKEHFVSLALCAVLAGGDVWLNVTTGLNRDLQAHSFLEFARALGRYLTWPFFDAPGVACVIALPLVLLLVFYFRPNFPSPRMAELLLALALWSIMQSAVIAYGRANYGEDVPSSRYMDVFNIYVIAGIFAAILLAQLKERHRLWKGMLALAFVIFIFCGLCRISQIVVDHLLAPTRMFNLVAEERVQRFVASGNESDFLERPTVRPDPQLALRVLRDPQLQKILPAICLPQSSASAARERLTPLSQWLQAHSMAILSAGLVLFVGLCGYGVVRGALGVPIMSLAGIFALSAAIFACIVVWSKHSVSREAVEYDLQRQIAANFKAAGNLKRAAIHEQKAEELKQFAN